VKYYARATAGTTMVLLEPDVAEAFSDGATVNKGLRSYLSICNVCAGDIAAMMSSSFAIRP
jgi:hypothetical protein